MRLFTEASPVETVLFTPPTSAYMKPATAAPTVTTVPASPTFFPAVSFQATLHLRPSPEGRYPDAAQCRSRRRRRGRTPPASG